MRRELYAMIVINPISFPDDLEIRVFPLSRKNDTRLGGFIEMSPHRSWEWVRNQYPVREDYLNEVEGYLKAGELANLICGNIVIDLPDGMEFPADDGALSPDANTSRSTPDSPSSQDF